MESKKYQKENDGRRWVFHDLVWTKDAILNITSGQIFKSTYNFVDPIDCLIASDKDFHSRNYTRNTSYDGVTEDKSIVTSTKWLSPEGWNVGYL